MSEMMGATPVYNVGNNDGFGTGAGGTWIWVFFLFFLLAWGGGGFGFGNAGQQAALQGSLTRADLCSEFNFNSLNNSVRAIQNGLCDGFYAMNNSMLQGFNSNYRDLTFGFNNVNQGLNGIQQNLNGLGYQMKDCCCGIERNIDAVRYENAQNTCTITNAIREDGEATRALINQNIMQGLRDKLEERDRELMAANFQISQINQTQNLVNQLQPVSKPAYITCSPYASANNCCGCGC